jgi:Cu+-exporting ATPase
MLVFNRYNNNEDNKMVKHRDIYQAILFIPGLQNEEDCKKINQTLKNLKGFENIEIDIENKKVTLYYDKNKLKYKKVNKTLQDTGYGVNNQLVTITIGDMMCLGCTGVIQNSLKLLEGVVDVNIDFKSKKAWIEYNPSLTDLMNMKEAILRAGHQYIIDVEGDGLSDEEIESVIDDDRSSQCDRIF